MKAEPMGRHELALELRFQIDMARKPGRPSNKAVLAQLIQSHPAGVASSHVRHNLGIARLAWLAQEGLVDEAQQVG